MEFSFLERRDACSVCYKLVRPRQEALQCDDCDKWVSASTGKLLLFIYILCILKLIYYYFCFGHFRLESYNLNVNLGLSSNCRLLFDIQCLYVQDGSAKKSQ